MCGTNDKIRAYYSREAEVLYKASRLKKDLDYAYYMHYEVNKLANRKPLRYKRKRLLDDNNL